MGKKKFHISREVLHKVAKTSSLSIKEIAEKAGYKYPTFYLHIKKVDLPYDKLARYGQVLGHDFSDEFPDMMDYIFKDRHVAYGVKKLIYEELETEKERWLNKYHQLNEKYQLLS
ncbi:hypothetical protein [Pedobacter glucosidilyticus]|uniref:hypothetical protein n=1 Tax=Pedobacter glucosidilyticus TaxID=1122941 RepID=UPI00040AE04B|nr:hypothetical protein [Pedobacter glucosidilyticus]